MRKAAAMLTGVLLLGGCDKFSGDAPHPTGRYAGIGIFDPGKLWSKIKASLPSGDPAAAKLEDDEHIIVVIDSHTGEVRQCGDHSGYCIATNPWKGGPATLPITLTKHLADLQDGTANVAEPEPAKAK